MGKIDELQKMVEEKGTARMKEIVQVASRYIEELDKIVREKNVLLLLTDTGFPMFHNQLGSLECVSSKGEIERKMLFLNATYVVRHLWEIVDNYGVKKNGNDLHYTHSIIFPDEKIKDINVVFNELKKM
ncbi:hypothetical protein K9M50_01520 [Patescibacteria group bacterium]|nr:hypothetical protein [Patescibacteria group bacterium]